MSFTLIYQNWRMKMCRPRSAEAQTGFHKIKPCLAEKKHHKMAQTERICGLTEGFFIFLLILLKSECFVRVLSTLCLFI